MFRRWSADVIEMLELTADPGAVSSLKRPEVAKERMKWSPLVSHWD